MRLLLDTQLLLLTASADVRITTRLSREAIDLISDLSNTLLYSAASIWEVAIKHRLGREDFKAEPRLLRRGLLDNGYLELAISSEHALTAGGLPDIHKDPFDRILVAQAAVEGVTLLTTDVRLASYPGPIIRV